MIPLNSDVLDAGLGVLMTLVSILDFTIDERGIAARVLFVIGGVTMLMSKPHLAFGEAAPLTLVLLGHCAVVALGPLHYVMIAIGMGMVIGCFAAVGAGVAFGRALCTACSARLAMSIGLLAMILVVWFARSGPPTLVVDVVLAARCVGIALSVVATSAVLRKAHAPEANLRVCVGLALVIAAAEAFPWPRSVIFANYLFGVATAVGMFLCLVKLTRIADAVVDKCAAVYAIGRPHA